ncbi:thiamine biosynthesis protein ThiJ [Corynebacterium sp. HMSC072D01]|uniref:DJ-1/PfpI family protein n=1 Tax=Corynebacterium sp. HMSC072D01 TaxID=1739403 RepID=UPI0008A845AA|nr:DJ-1/PfpI family protein [Corynebacterium sp. HMSC072D01]OHR24708.1 thiamine biosynthesis protein ThiJ [Corynebacterium sp. HMSC072D01]
MANPEAHRRVTVVLFPGFELLDVFGPVGLFGHVPEIEVEYVADIAGSITSAQGAEVIATRCTAELEAVDILLVPGGAGSRTLVEDAEFLDWLKHIGSRARLVASVCTGSALLAAAGLLEGKRATSNKLAFDWATSFGNEVTWVKAARWVEDGDRWSSSGVAAGMDMAVALISSILGKEAGRFAARKTEYRPQTDGTVDPFADLAK